MDQERLTGALPGIEDSLNPMYLGNPDLVTRLVADFCTSLMGLVETGDGAAFKSGIVILVNHYADIFAGRLPDYKTVIGYNEVTLPQKLKADLGEFWQAQRSAWDDDPIAVLFWWLVVHLVGSIKRADGDEMLYEVMVTPYVQGVVRRLLGIEARHG